MGTSGRKGRDCGGISKQDGNSGAVEIGCGSGVLCEGLARKKANHGRDGRGAGTDGSRGVELETLAAWAALGRSERAARISALETDNGIRETEACSIRNVGDAGTSPSHQVLEVGAL